MFKYTKKYAPKFFTFFLLLSWAFLPLSNFVNFQIANTKISLAPEAKVALADTQLFQETCGSANVILPSSTTVTGGTWGTKVAIFGTNAATYNSGQSAGVCSVAGTITANTGIAYIMSTAPTTSSYYVRATQIDTGNVATSESQGILMNYIDADNYYACHYVDDPASGLFDVYITKNKTGANSTLASQTAVGASMTSGDNIECRITYDGSTPTITITNITDSNEVYLTATDSSSPLTETKKAGVFCGATDARTADECVAPIDMDNITLFDAPPVTTLGDGTDPGNSTIAPGASATEIDRFSLSTTYGTDTVTGMTVTLAGQAITYTNIATVDVQTTAGASKCSSSSWGSDNLVELTSCAIAVTATPTDYKVMITPKTHANMAAVSGASFPTTATVTAVTDTNTDTGTDTDSATITVDNASPGNWTPRSAAGNDDYWKSVTYGNSTFVAVGGLNAGMDRVMTSTDGTTWTPRSAANNDDIWESVTYGNSTFVAVGSSGDRVMTSTDGTTWTARSAAGNDDAWYSVTYGNGLFVAVGGSGIGFDRVMTSTDGTTWTARSAAGDNDTWTGVIYANSLFVAVGNTGGADKVMTSADGTTWTARSAAGNDDYWSDVTYANSTFVAVGGNTTGDRVMTSSNGTTWTAQSAAGNDDAWNSVTYGNGTFVAVGGLSTAIDKVMTSPDGTTWTVQSAAGNDDFWFSVIYANSTFVAVAGSSSSIIDRVMTSTNLFLTGTATPGDAVVDLSWATPPTDTDYTTGGTVVVLRRASSAITQVPVEGTTYSVGNTIGGVDTVACVVTGSPPATTCQDASLSNGTAYHYKIFTQDSNGNYDAGTVPTGSPATPVGFTTTLGDGTDPGNSTIAPGGAATYMDAFTVQRNSGSTTLSALTVTLDVANSFNNIATAEIKDDSGVTDQCTDITNPASNTLSFTGCTLPVTASSVQFRVYITPKTHANMPAVPGASYATTGHVTSITPAAGSATGTDTDSGTITVDNLSPNNATSTSATAGNALVTVNWTTSSGETTDAVLLRWASATAGSEVPVEGSSYTAGNTITTATVACVITGQTTATALSKIDGTGGSSGCNTSALTNGQAYSYKVFHKDANGNYDAGVSTGLENKIPAASVTTTASTTGTQTTNLSKNTTNQYVGGAFTFAADGAVNVTAMTITESGTIDGATNLDNIKLYYESDTSAPYNCASESYAGSELQFGATDTDGFSAADGTSPFSGTSVGLTTTSTLCIYPVLDVTSGATGGQTIELSIAATGDYTVSTGSKSGTPSIAGTTTIRNHTTLGDGTDPGNSTIAPGGAATYIDAFTLQADNATDTVTALTVTLGVASSYDNIATVEIKETTGVTDQCTDITNPSSVTLNFTGCTLAVSTASTPFRVYITPKTHANMPAVPGASYATTATVTALTLTGSSSGTDTDSGIITVDNASPAGVTSSTASAGNTVVDLAWTNPVDGDFDEVVVLRRTDSDFSVNKPVEGTDYHTVGATIGSSTVACFTSTTSCQDTSLSNGTAYHYKIFTQDTNGNYNAGTVPTGSPATPNVTTAGTTGSQTTNLSKNTTNQYVGGAFSFTGSSSVNVTGITITESGTINASTNLDNIKLYYESDTSAPYNCASESYAGSELQFGSTDTDGFSAADGTSAFTATVGITATSTLCVYPVLDVTSGATGGETIELSIASTSDFTVSAGNKSGTPSIAGTTTIRNHTTLADGTDPGNSTIAPGGAATYIDAFTLQTDNSTDTVTALTVTLGVASSYDNIATVEIKEDTGATDQCTDITNPSSTTLSFTGCTLPVTTSPVQFRVYITPKTHTNMPAVPGASYATTATVTALTLTGSSSGTDTDSGIITVDNASPGAVTSSTATAGDTVVNLAWTNPVDSDFDEVIVLRHTSAITDAPTEGTEPVVTNIIGSATVVCVTSTTSCQDSSLSNGTPYHYKIFTQDTNGNYNAGTVPTGSPATPVDVFVVSGTAYANDGTTALGAGKTVALRVNGTLAGTGDGGTGLDDTDASGNWSITGLTATAGATVTVYMNAETETGNTITITDGSTDITSTPVYDDHLIVKSDNGATAITILDLLDYDSDQNNTDMVFDAEDAATDTLITEDGNKLVVWTGDTFTPGGNITTDPSASASSKDGDVEIKATSTLDMGTNALSIGGDFANAGTFSESGSPQVTTFTATATGHTIDNGTGNLDKVIFNGAGGGWSFSDASNTLAGDLTMTAGTLSGTTNLTVDGGDVTGDGTITLTGGTLTVNTTGNFGGATAWTFSSLTVGAAGNATTTATGAGGITVSSVLTIDSGDTLDAGSKTWTLSGSGTPFVKTGTLTASTSTFQYTGTSATNIAAATYNNLNFAPGSAATYTMPGSTLTIGGNLSIGANTTVTKGAGTVVFAKTGGGTQTWTDSTAAIQDIGAVQVSASGGATTLSSSTNIKATSITVDASQNLNIDSDTLTLTGSGTPFTLSGTNTFTVTGSTVNYIGTSATDVKTTTYNHLGIGTTSDATAVTYTPGAGSLSILGNLTIGIASDTAAKDIFQVDTSDPTLDVDGNVSITAGGTLVASATATTTFGGDYTNSGILTSSSGTITFDAGDTGNILSGDLSTANVGKPFNVIFNNASGGWSNSSALVTTGDLTVTAGTLSGTQNVVVDGGDVTGNGTINKTGGVFIIDSTGTFGGDSNWTFANLNFGDPVGTPTTTAIGTGSITVTTVMKIRAHVLEAGSKTWILSGSGTPLVVEAGATLTPQTSTFQYTGTLATNIAGTTYNNLSLIPTDSATYTLGTAGSQTISTNNFTIGNGSTAVAVDHATWDPAIDVSGNLTIAAGAGTFTKSDAAAVITLKPSGSKTWSDATNQDIGVVVIGSGSSTPKITLTSGVKATSLNINASHELDLGSYTMNLTGTGTPFVVGGTFTPSTGTVNYSNATSANIAATTYNNLTLGAGTYTAPAGTITIGDDFTNGGTFTHNSGTVVFNNSANISTISGATSFNNFTVATNDKTVKFTSGQTFTTNGLLTLTGTTGHNVVVTSSDGATDWTINHQGTESVNYLTVSYSACHGSSTPISNTNTTFGNNVGTCWERPLTISQGASRIFQNVNGAVNFGTSGIVTADSASNSPEAIALDGTYMYVAGFEGSFPYDWRIEKRLLTDGSLDSGFGTSGVVTSAAASNAAYAIAIDSTYMYLTGTDNNYNWRIEKRLLTDGSLDSGFGTSGVVTGAAESYFPLAIAIDSTSMYVGGNSTNEDFRIEKRFLSDGSLDSNFGTNGVVAGVATSQAVHSLSIDSTYMYIGGYDSNNDWRIEKRRLGDGFLDSDFGTGGVITGAAASVYPSYAIPIDSTYMYIAGYDSNSDWRIVKRLLSDGSLDSNFGTNGIVTGAAATDFPSFMSIDSTYMYVIGYDSTPNWRIEKRLLSDGSLDSGFGTSGVITGAAGNASEIAIDKAFIYAIGQNSTPDWRIEKRFMSDGSLADTTKPAVGPALAAQNTAATLTASGQAFRLRTLIHAGGQQIAQNGETFKLQYAAKSGSCDTGFSGETYADISTNTPISFYDNPALADGDSPSTSPFDPTDGNTKVTQKYEELNNFTNSTATIPVNQDGIWDFALYDNGANQGSSYCIRAVKSTGTLLDTYTSIPEVITPAPALTQFGYVWRNDNGSQLGADYLLDSNIPLDKDIYTGDNRRLRIGISNTGNATATSITYQLEYSSGACTVWNTMPTSAGSDPWKMVSSGNVSNGAATTDSPQLKNPANKTFVAGQVMTTANTTSGITLTPSQFTEVEYNIEPTANAVTGTNYCFRVTNAGSATGFGYSEQPKAKAFSFVFVPRGGGGNAGGESSGSGGSVGGGGAGGGGGGGGSSIASGTAVLNAGAVESVTINSGGSGYGSPPSVSFCGGGGSGASGTSVMSNGVVLSVTMNSGGSNYSTPPTVVFGGTCGGSSGGGGGGDSGALPRQNLLATSIEADGSLRGLFSMLFFSFSW